MKTLSFAALTIALTVCTGCSSDKGTGNALPSGDAVYDVAFSAFWSAATHPDGFPGNPHFSSVVGGSHNSSVSFWEDGGLATEGIRAVAERGAPGALTEEVMGAIDSGTAGDGFIGGHIARSPGENSLNLAVTAEFPLVTLVSMLAPSPDWFVGVSGLSLWQNGEWVETLTVDLYLYDAGTDDGTSYTSANAASNPHVPIMPIAGYPALVADEIPRMGTFTFTRM